MSDETKSVSMQVPTEIPSEISRLSEQAKTASETTTAEKTVVTLRASPEQLKNLSELRKDLESFERSKLCETHAVTDRFIKTSELRISFYEKLILLAGGSFALSLTFLGSLQRHALQ
jgi:hypothetical protein